MDALPPQAPPAITRPVQHEAVHALNRIVVTGNWIREQQQAMPDIEDVLVPGARARRHDDLNRYWSSVITSEGRSSERKACFAEHLAMLAGDLGALMAQDGSLDMASATMIHRLVMASDGLPPGLRIDELTVHDKALAATLVVRDEALPDHVLIFTPDRGWVSFDSVDAMLRDVERRARFTSARRIDLPGLDRLDTDEAMDDFAIALRPLTTSPWHALTERILALQREKTDQAWFEARLLGSPRTRTTWLTDRLHAATRLDDLIDTDALLTLREENLHHALRAERLASVPASHRQDMQAAVDTYRSAHALAQGLLTDSGLGIPHSFSAFAQQARVKAWLPEQYAAYLETLNTGPDGALRRDLSLGVAIALMRLRAEGARLDYFNPGQSQTFRDDFAERGYRWVRVVLDAPAPMNRQRVEGHEVVASQVLVAGEPVEGVIALGARQHRAVSTVLLYLPDAPDGRYFREFGDWDEAVREVFHAPGFQAYLADRLPGLTVDQKASPHVIRQEVTGDIFRAIWQTALDTSEKRAKATDGDRDTTLALPRLLTAPFTMPARSWAEPVSLSTPQRTPRSLLSWVMRPFRSRTALALPGGRSSSVLSLRTIRSTPGVFDDVFRAPGLPPHGKPDARGLHTIDGQTYIVHDSHLYRARYDSAFDTVRLQRHGSSPASYGPPVRRMDDQHWTFNKTGLMGGRKVHPDPYARQRPHLHDRVQEQRTTTAAFREQFLNDPAPIALPVLPDVPVSVPAGHRLLATHELPERVHATWFRSPNRISGTMLPDGYVRYLRMDVQTLSAGNRGVPVRSMPAPPEPGNRAQSIVINLRTAHGRLDGHGQPRFDVYRSDSDAESIILRPRGPGALEFRNHEFLTTSNPATYFPATN